MAYLAKCKNCGSDDILEDDVRGDIVCRGCGLVQQARIVDPTAEWRTFGGEERRGVDMERVGAPTDPFYTGGMLGTSIEQVEGGKLSALARLHKKADLNKTDRGLERGYNVIQGMVAKMGLVKKEMERAMSLYKQLDEKKPLRGPKMAKYAAAAVFAACRESDVPRTFLEVATVCSVPHREIAKAYSRLCSKLKIQHKITSAAGSVIQRYCNMLNLPLALTKLASDISTRATHELIGRNPIAVAAASILLAVTLRKVPLGGTDEPSLDEIANVTLTGATSIKVVVKAIAAERKKLFGKSFTVGDVQATAADLDVSWKQFVKEKVAKEEKEQ